MDRRGRQSVFAHTRSDRHRAHCFGQIASPRPHHFEGELRHPVAEPAQIQIADHDIGRPAIGRDCARALDSLHHRVRQLIRAPRIDIHRQIARRDLDPVGPDATNPRDLTLAKRNRHAHAIGIAGHGGGPAATALAAARALFGDGLQKPRRPDHLTWNAHAPMDRRHRRPLARACQPEPVDPPGFHR